jgi:hypothetical protein
LQRDTEREDKTSDDDTNKEISLDPWESGETVRTPIDDQDITSWSGQKSAEESTGGEDGYDERLVRGRDAVGTVAFVVTELLQPSLGNKSRVGWEQGRMGKDVHPFP